MEKEELLSLAGVVALLVVGDADTSEEDELSEPVSDGVVVPLAESEMVYPGDTAGDSTVPLSEIHPAMIIQVTRANEAAIEPMAIFFCRAFFFCAASSAVFRVFLQQVPEPGFVPRDHSPAFVRLSRLGRPEGIR